MFRYLSAATCSAPFREWFRGGQREEKKEEEEESGGGLYFLEKGQRRRGKGSDVGTHTSEPVRFNFSRALALIVKNIGPGWESGKIVQGPSTGSWPKKGSNLLEFTTLSPRGKLRDGPCFGSRASNRGRNREPREPLVCEEREKYRD